MRKEFVFICAFHDSIFDMPVTYALIRETHDLNEMIDYLNSWLDKYENKFGNFKAALMFENHGRDFIGVISNSKMSESERWTNDVD